MVYEMLTGDMPLFPDNSSFGGWYEAHHHTKPQPMNPIHRVPSEIEALVMKCLAKSPHSRPQKIDEVLRAIEAIEAVSASQPKPANQVKPLPNFDPTIINLPDNSGPTIIADRTLSRTTLPGVKETCLQMGWPQDKPVQKIVFPQVLRASEGTFATLWVMLDQQDILSRMTSIRYNQFLMMTSPHPMILWITVLYHREHGPRWLPCYLDLKTSSGQRLANLLGEGSKYWILFFSLENPQRCQQSMTATIAPNQCKLLKEWAANSQMMPGDKPQITKRLLKQEFEKLKPKIVGKLANVNPAYAKDISS